MKWRTYTPDYLLFTRKDRIAIMLLVLVITAVFLVPTTFSNSGGTRTAADTAWVAGLKRIELKEAESGSANRDYSDNNSTAYQYDRSANNYYKKPKGELFYFDPNTLSTEGWQQLGLREKTISTIQHYLSKGGQFRKPEDLQRIYGLFPNEYERIAPYIQIKSTGGLSGYRDFSDNSLKENQPAKTYSPRYTSVDINVADTTALIALPGIGTKLAFRIINFRDKLGGFYSVSQVAETFGLPDSTFQRIKQYLKLDNAAVKKININTATVDELKAHPYIRWALANPIVAYRKEHGPFAKMEDLKKVMAVTDELYNKMVPYLSLQ